MKLGIFCWLWSTCFLSIHSWTRLQRIHGWLVLQSKGKRRQPFVLTVWSRVRPGRWKLGWCEHLWLRVPQCRPNEFRQAQHWIPQHSMCSLSSANAFHRHYGAGPQLLSWRLDSRVLRISDGGSSWTSSHLLHLHGPWDENTSWTWHWSKGKSVV